MRLVVGDAAGDELAVALDERPRIGLPELEGIGRLDVEMRVGEHRRRAVPGRGGDVADDERAPVPLLDLGRAAGRRDPRRDPVRGRADVAAALGVGADGRDRDQLGEVVDERVVRRDHGRDRSGTPSTSGRHRSQRYDA